MKSKTFYRCVTAIILALILASAVERMVRTVCMAWIQSTANQQIKTVYYGKITE